MSIRPILRRTIELPFRLIFSPSAADHAARLCFEMHVAMVHRLGVLRARRWKRRQNLRINFGSGRHVKDGFLNVDMSPDADLRLDLRRAIPLSDASADVILAEHFLEHLKYPDEANLFIDECYRILQSNGRIYLSVPMADWPIREYVGGGKAYLDHVASCGFMPDECTTFMEKINFAFRQRWPPMSETSFECHRFAYDYETMAKLLQNAGFQDICERKFDAEFDSEHRRVGSLFVTARKYG